MVSRFYSPLPFRSKNTELKAAVSLYTRTCLKHNKKLKSFQVYLHLDFLKVHVKITLKENKRGNQNTTRP